MKINNQNIQFVAGLHGNEKGPIKALSLLQIDFILGNPEASAANTRYIDQDLNASFGFDNGTYESSRAAEILELISQHDIVIDFHTTSAITESFIILTDISQLKNAQFSGLKKAVIMTYNIKNSNALINHRDGFSIEISGYDNEISFNETLKIIKSLKSGSCTEPELYEVYGIISEPGEYTNFELHSEGFYPVLAGEVAYDFYGLKAKKH